MQWKEDLLSELKLLESSLMAKNSDLEKGVDMIEAKSKEREGERKAIFLREMKKLLIILNDVDKKVTKDLKNEAFDNIRSMNKIKDEITALGSQLVSPDSNLAAGDVIQSLNILKSKAVALEESFPTSNLSLSVAHSPEQMVYLANTIRAAVYLKTPVLDPHHYSLDCSALFSPDALKDSLVELRLHCSLPTRRFNPLVLSKLVLLMTCPDGSHFQSRRVLEEASVAELIKKKKAFVSTPSSLMIQVKKPKNLVVTVEVKLLESDVLNSPRVFSFFSNSNNDTVVQDVTVLDTTGTGQLCSADLDITEVDMSSTTPTPTSATMSQFPPTQPIVSSSSVPTTLTVPVTSQSSVWSETAQTTSPSENYSADPFGSPHSPLQPTGPTPPKLCRQSSNIPDSPPDFSDCLTYFSPLDSTNPHLLLNASLAPGNCTLNATYLPDPCWDDSRWCPSPPSSTNHQNANTTLWEVPSSPPVPSLFLSIKLKSDKVFRALQAPLSSSRTPLVLLSPYNVTLYQPTGTDAMYLVSEPLHDRIGIYSPYDMTYIGPLGKGHVLFQYPTSLLGLSGGGLVLLDKNRMHIFNEQCALLVQFHGRFHGLTEGENEEIFSFSERENKIVRLAKVKGRYCIKQWIKLTVVKEFDNWKNLSKPRHLVYNMGRLHISDKGLHKLLLVDLSTGQQTASGYLGDGVGQFKRPAGMVVDKEGNLLVVDQGNNRVLVFTGSGNFVRVAAVGQEGLEQPSGICVCEDSVMVAYTGNKEGSGGLVRYKMEE